MEELWRLPQGFQETCGTFAVLHKPFPWCLIWYIDMWIHALLALAGFVTRTASAPSGFPASGNGLWFTKPGTVWSRELLPIGNGYLAGTVTH